jgi:hypothetical protein
VATLRQIFALRADAWELLNSANITLLPKKAQVIGDYRPMSLMHSVAKIFGKILANRLAPHLDHLVSTCQSVFIKGRSIQDNFQYVQGVVRHFHCSKSPMLLLKLDITKAFDNVRWEYMLEVMTRLGFGQRWRNIMALLWRTTTSCVLLNGAVGNPITHLRQGDPLSPLLFILAIDPLRILDKATADGLLTPIGASPVKLRTSLYLSYTDTSPKCRTRIVIRIRYFNTLILFRYRIRDVSKIQ